MSIGQIADKSVKISVRVLNKCFTRKREKGNNVKQFVALKDFSLDVRESEFLSIVGPSGCGKSTFLDLLSGLSEPTSGGIYIDEKKVEGPALDRGIVMQGYALFPWRSVRKNVEYGLEVKGMPKQERREISQKFLELVGLEEFAERYPYELSGGMKQRVAIARALAYDPEVLLMDEPFGALDAQTREILQDELLRIWAATQKTIIFVTHSIDEAIYLSDRVVVLSANPGTLRDIFPIELRRPRDGVRLTPDYLELTRRIADSLHGKTPPSQIIHNGDGI
ncbi:Taurine-transporting ATPase [Syntrophobotulus glycolicus DSM 8271]|uniref:Taurine-transporting ATPase n=1 Tax=Syntrophobotulus glycolicus (strain DSM 8271 / FlGlyR) TaxID=645991 RepID=F0SW45_SYNGF|nr:ABC transporter ATP-binding protein [Syntrophobotulus glycolicus]ADY56829.1 Taurine-transporting ATPase [Syntrophobotulus glycolicus DSM 8271]